MRKGLWFEEKKNQLGIMMSAEFLLTQEDILNLKSAKYKVFVNNRYWTVMPFTYDGLQGIQTLRLDLYTNEN